MELRIGATPAPSAPPGGTRGRFQPSDGCDGASSIHCPVAPAPPRLARGTAGPQQLPATASCWPPSTPRARGWWTGSTSARGTRVHGTPPIRRMRPAPPRSPRCGGWRLPPAAEGTPHRWASGRPGGGRTRSQLTDPAAGFGLRRSAPGGRNRPPEVRCARLRAAGGGRMPTSRWAKGIGTERVGSVSPGPRPTGGYPRCPVGASGTGRCKATGSDDFEQGPIAEKCVRDHRDREAQKHPTRRSWYRIRA